MDCWVDAFQAFGLALTTIGAGVTARAVILSENDLITIAAARYAGETREENLKLPSVRNLSSASRAAQGGLWTIVAGAVLQVLPLVARIILTL